MKMNALKQTPDRERIELFLYAQGRNPCKIYNCTKMAKWVIVRREPFGLSILGYCTEHKNQVGKLRLTLGIIQIGNYAESKRMMQARRER